MRVDIPSVKLETLLEALAMLQYSRLSCDGSEWRRGGFHLFIRRRRKRGLVLYIHVDVPSPTPPFHRARHRGRDLKLEVERILEAYRRLRAGL
jgi:hypothetical protein